MYADAELLYSHGNQGNYGSAVAMVIVRAHVTISGRVQGVYFRGTVKEMAQSMGLNGWVRNLTDGRVEAVFEGEADDVRRMVSWCEKGPPAARVDDVTTDWGSPTRELSGFKLRRTETVS
jgi:acylphosphatase